jgi:hypothetical protein
MVAPVHNYDPKILPEGSAKLRLVMRGAGGPHISWPLCTCGKKKALDVGGPSSTDIFLGVKQETAKLRWARRGGAQRPVLRVNEPKKTDARSARARTRGQNPLV